MKKILFITILALGSFCFAKAQGEDADKRADKIRALKIAFITEQLSLTSEEAQRFWPVYSQYENEVKSLYTDKINGDVIDNEEKLLNIRKKYRPEFVKILGQPRMNKLFNAEGEFRRILLQRLRNRNNQQPPMLRNR